jgi:2'-5' RNA ligase
MKRTRTFIAVDVTPPIRNKLVALQTDLGRTVSGAKWVEPANIHLTLVFLGEVDDREIPTVCRAAEEAAAQRTPISATIRGVGCFPHLRRPRVVWAGIDQGGQELIALHDALETLLEQLGYRREDRRYTPHVTLGRINSDRIATQNLTAAINRLADWVGGDMIVAEIQIMGSQLGSTGPVYTVLGRARLGQR